MKTTLLTVALVLLAGCAANYRASQSAGPSMADQMAADRNRVEALCRDRLADPVLDPLRSKMGLLSDSDTTFEMLTNTEKPTEAEKVAIVALANKKSECIKERIVSMRRFSVPEQLVTLDELVTQRFQIMLADLHNGILSYGDFARKRKELVADYKMRKTEMQGLLAQRSKESKLRAEQLAVESRKAAIMEQQAADQRHENQMRQVQTNPQIRCTTFGNVMTCQ